MSGTWCTGCGEHFTERTPAPSCPSCGRPGTVVIDAAKPAQVVSAMANADQRRWYVPADRRLAIVVAVGIIIGAIVLALRLLR